MSADQRVARARILELLADGPLDLRGLSDALGLGPGFALVDGDDLAKTLRELLDEMVLDAQVATIGDHPRRWCLPDVRGARQFVTIDYVNHRGGRSVRRILPTDGSLRFGASPHHPDPQWLFDAVCMERRALRTFSHAGVRVWGCGHRALGPVDETAPHPLSPLLGADWRWLTDGGRQTVVLLHESGLWVEFTIIALETGATEWAEVVRALHAAVAEGMIGRHTIEATRTHGLTTCRVVPVANPIGDTP